MQNINALNNEGDFSHIKNKCTTLIRNIKECDALLVFCSVCVRVRVHQFGLPAFLRLDTIPVCSTHTGIYLLL